MSRNATIISSFVDVQGPSGAVTLPRHRPGACPITVPSQITRHLWVFLNASRSVRFALRTIRDRTGRQHCCRLVPIAIPYNHLTRKPAVTKPDAKHVHTMPQVRNHTVATVAGKRGLPCMWNLFLQIFTIPIQTRTRTARYANCVLIIPFARHHRRLAETHGKDGQAGFLWPLHRIRTVSLMELFPVCL